MGLNSRKFVSMEFRENKTPPIISEIIEHVLLSFLGLACFAMEDPGSTEGTTIQEDIFRVENTTTFNKSFLLQNVSEPEGPSLYMFTPWTAYFFFSLAWLFLGVGLFGNVITLIITLKSKGSSKSHNTLIMSLALMDTLALVTFPINQPSFMEIMWVYIEALNNVICGVFMVIYRTASFNATLMNLLISIERFIVVWFPLKSKQLLTTKVLIISIVSCSLGSLVLYVLPALFRNLETIDCTNQESIAANVGNQRSVLGIPMYIITRLLLVALPAMILLILTPLTIGKLLHIRAKRRHLTTQSTDTGTFRISVLLMSVVITFLLLFVVPNLIRIGLSAGRISVNTDIFLECVFILSHINHSTNFLLYAVFLKEFREKLIAYLSCACIKTDGNDTAANKTSSTRPTV